MPPIQTDPAKPRTPRQNWLIFIVVFFGITAASLLVANLNRHFSSPKPLKYTTNILSWWGFFDDRSKIEEVEQLCDTKIKIKDYLSIKEFRSWMKEKNYDIYIYPWSSDLTFDNQHFNEQGPRINFGVKDYHDAIKEKYYQANLSQDTVFFQHGVRTFVYDKNHIDNLDRLNAKEILNLAYSSPGKVILANNVLPLDWLIKQINVGTPEDNWIDLYQQFRGRQTQRADHSGLRFSNATADYLDSNLSLGFLASDEIMNPKFDWSAVKDASGQPKAFEFSMHPHLSPVSSNVLALKSSDDHNQCVAKAMVSRDFLKWVAEKNFTFSPYEERLDHSPEPMQRLAQQFYDNAGRLTWQNELISEERVSPEAEMIWDILTACQKGSICDQWTAMGDKAFISQN